MEKIDWYNLEILVFDNIKDMRIYVANGFKTDEYLLFLYQGYFDKKILSTVLLNEICGTILHRIGIRRIRKEFPVMNKYIIIKDQEFKHKKKYSNIGRTNIRKLKANIKLYPNGLWYARIMIGSPQMIFNITGDTFESVIEKKRTFYEEHDIKYIDE